MGHKREEWVMVNVPDIKFEHGTDVLPESLEGQAAYKLVLGILPDEYVHVRANGVTITVFVCDPENKHSETACMPAGQWLMRFDDYIEAMRPLRTTTGRK